MRLSGQGLILVECVHIAQPAPHTGRLGGCCLLQARQRVQGVGRHPRLKMADIQASLRF